MAKRRLKVCHRHQRYRRRKKYQLAKAEKNQESNSNNNPGDDDDGDPQELELQGRHPTTTTEHHPSWDPSIVKEEPMDDDFIDMQQELQPEDQLPSKDDDDDDDVDIKADVDSLEVEEVSSTPTKSSSPRTKSKGKPRKTTSSSPKKKKKTPQPKEKKKQDGKKKKQAAPKRKIIKHPSSRAEWGWDYPDNWDSMTPEEQDAWRVERRRKTNRENSALRRAFRQPDATGKYKRRELTQEEKEERKKRQNFQRLVKRATMTEEELKEEKMRIYMKKCAWLSTLTQEEIEVNKRKECIAKAVKRAKMTPEERAEKRRREAEARKNLSEEEKARLRETRSAYQRKWWDKMKRERPLEYQARMHDMAVKHREKVLVYLRNKTQNETPEEREKRLLRYRVNQAKRKARKQLEEEGVTCPEEIKRRLEEVAEQVRNTPRAPSTSQYKPREGARKPHGQIRPMVTPEEAGIVIRVGVKGKLPKYPEVYSKLAEVEDKEKISISRIDIPTMFPKTWEEVRKEIVSGGDVDESKLPSQIEFKKPAVRRGRPRGSFQPEPKPPPPPAAPPAAPVQHSTNNSPNNNSNKMELGMIEEDSCGSPPLCGGGAEDDDIDDDFPMEFDTTGGVVEEDDDDSMPVLEPQHSQHGEEIGEQILLLSSVEPAAPPSPPPIAPSPVPYVPPPPVSTTSTSAVVVVPSTAHVKTGDAASVPVVPAQSQPPGTTTPITTVKKQEVETVVKLPEALVDGGDEDLSLPAICDICGKVLKTGYSLRRHKEQLHDLTPNETRCPQCGLECGSSRTLWTHYSTTHMGQISSESEDIKVMVHSEVANPNYNPAPPPSSSTKPKVPQKRGTDGHNTCWHCGKNFKQKATMDDHIRRVHEGKGFYCDLCPSRGDLQSSAKLWKHKVDKHGIPPEELPPPTDRWGAIPIVNCVYCGEALLRGYEAHVKKRHPEELDQWRAENIQPDGSTRKLVRMSERAVVSISRSAARSCPECSKVVRNSSLRRHLKNVHGIGKIEMFKCDECGMEFKDRPRLNEHTRYQHQYGEIDDRLEAKGLVKFNRPLKQVDCLVCNNTKTIKVVAPDTLRAHFVAEHHLLLEQLQSSTEPLFPCEHCPQKFQNRKARHVHAREAHPEVEPPPARPPHFGKVPRKPHHGTKKKAEELSNVRTVCLKCRKVVRLRDVGKHLRVKHGEKDPRFVCEFCNKSFRRREFHVSHLEMVHKVPRDQLIVVPTKEELEWSKKESYKHLFKKSKNKQQHFKKSRRRVGRPRKCAKKSGRTAEAEHKVDESEIEKEKRLVIRVVRLAQEEIDKYMGRLKKEV